MCFPAIAAALGSAGTAATAGSYAAATIGTAAGYGGTAALWAMPTLSAGAAAGGAAAGLSAWQLANLALSGTSTLVGAQAAGNQAAYAKGIAQNNAIEAERAAADARARGEEDVQDVRRRASMLQGSQRAAMAARGLDLGEGTAADILAQTEFFSSIDQATARDNARRQARGYTSQANNFSAQARASSPSGARNVSLLGGAVGLSDKWMQYTR